MITDLMLQILGALMNWVVSMRPTWAFNIPQSAYDLVGLARDYNSLLPINEMLSCLYLFSTLTVGSTVVKWSIKIVDYIADVIP